MTSPVRELAPEPAVRYSPWRVRQAAAVLREALPVEAALQVRLQRRVPARARWAQRLQAQAQRSRPPRVARRPRAPWR